MSKVYGFLRSLTKTSQDEIELTIKQGLLPSWLHGTLYRNGPGRFEYGDKSHKHLFDGHALVHKFKIGQGKVKYSNKFLETKSYTEARNNNILYPVFGTPDACVNIFDRLKTFFYELPDTFDNTNVTITPFGNEHLFALTETNFLNQLNPSNLEIKEKFNLSKHVSGATTLCAHPHLLEDGSWITMGISRQGITAYYDFFRYMCAPSDQSDPLKLFENSQLITRIPGSFMGLSYFHSFGLTKNYIVFLEHSLRFDFTRILESILFNKPISNILVVDKTFETRIHVIDRQTGFKIKKEFLTEPMVVFHHINAYETTDGTKIMIDVCAYDVNFVDVTKWTRENMQTDKLLGTKIIRSLARRIIVPMKSNEETGIIYCQVSDINSEVSFELPVINYSKFNSRKYKYVYGTNLFRKPFTIVKINVDDGQQVVEHAYDQDEEQCLPSEPVFVPNPSGSNEDDGVLLVVVLSSMRDYLSVLDAKDLKEIARAEVPENVEAAFTFHGFFADFENFPKLNV